MYIKKNTIIGDCESKLSELITKYRMCTYNGQITSRLNVLTIAIALTGNLVTIFKENNSNIKPRWSYDKYYM